MPGLYGSGGDKGRNVDDVPLFFTLTSVQLKEVVKFSKENYSPDSGYPPYPPTIVCSGGGDAGISCTGSTFYPPEIVDFWEVKDPRYIPPWQGGYIQGDYMMRGTDDEQLLTLVISYGGLYGRWLYYRPIDGVWQLRGVKDGYLIDNQNTGLRDILMFVKTAFDLYSLNFVALYQDGEYWGQTSNATVDAAIGYYNTASQANQIMGFFGG